MHLTAEYEVLAVFEEVLEAMQQGYRHYALWGGRAGGKSIFIHNDDIDEVVQGNGSICYVRYYKESLRETVFQDVCDTIEEMGLSDIFDITVSPLLIRCKINTCCISFLGLDSYQKKKGLKPPQLPDKKRKQYEKELGIKIEKKMTPFLRVVYEEVQEILDKRKVEEFNATVLRGLSKDCIFFYLFNPKSNPNSWENTDLRTTIDGYLFSKKVTYKGVPVRLLGEGFIEEAERLKEINYNLYLYRYEGEPISCEDRIFENTKFRRITDEQIERWLDEDTDIYQGLDFGYHPDPNAGNTMHYDRESRILYIFNEFNQGKLNNQQISQGLDKAGILRDYRITADNDSKTINDLKDLGWDIRAAIKGPGSRDTGMEWLQGLTQIVIDEKRCPKTAEEFENYIYKVNKDGEVKGMYPEGQKDHHIAAVRYAMEVVWRRKGM